MAGEIFRELMDMVRSALQQRDPQATQGTILLGTVRGGIHDLGKNMVALLLMCYGFTVVDRENCEHCGVSKTDVFET